MPEPEPVVSGGEFSFAWAEALPFFSESGPASGGELLFVGELLDGDSTSIASEGAGWADMADLSSGTGTMRAPMGSCILSVAKLGEWRCSVFIAICAMLYM